LVSLCTFLESLRIVQIPIDSSLEMLHI